MYKRQRQGWIRYLDYIVLDLVCLLASYAMAFYIRHHSFSYFVSTKIYQNMIAVMLIIDLLIIVLTETLQRVRQRDYLKELNAVIQQDVALLAAVTVYLFTVKDSGTFSRSTLWMTIALHMISNFGGRTLLKRYRSREREAEASVLLVADASNVGKVLERLKGSLHNRASVTGLVIVGETKQDFEIPVVCDIHDAPEYICHEWIDEVYITTAEPQTELIHRCVEMGVIAHVEIDTSSEELPLVERMDDARVLTYSMNTASPGELLLKRLMDIVGGIVGSIIALVIIAIVGPKIKKASPGPIIFTQERIGRNGKRFQFYKLRSMYPDAEARRAELMKDNRYSDGRMFKLEFDPRIIGNEVLPDGTQKTGIGEFIRRTSLDEFPQFFCVLKGDMSRVGTRPPLPDEWEKYAYHHRARLAFKPGITGMWQVSGRSDITDFEEVVKLDTEYIHNWSLGLDIRILFKTISGVLKSNGAM